ncbi:MAG: hypothetical protein NT124_00350 [Candidatus Dependentiae bacterium]|nr:hypothetical protein [Candidatus Dependentiae bacterium]
MKKIIFCLLLVLNITSRVYSIQAPLVKSPIQVSQDHKQAFLASPKAALVTWYKNKKKLCAQQISQCAHFLIKNRGLEKGVKLALAAGCAYLLYKNRVDVVVAFLGGGWLLHDRINVGRSVCNGRNHNPLADTVFLRQIEVPEQEGSSCAYHALRNAIIMVDGVRQGHADIQARLDGQVDRVASVDALIGNQEAPWRAIVNAGRQQPGQGSDMLDIQEINRLRPDEGDNHRISAPGFNPDQSITIVDNIAFLRMNDEEAFNVGVNFGPIRDGRALAAAQLPPIDYVHGFVLGNMQENVNDQGCVRMGTNGHWISVVLHQRPNGHTEYTVTDSNRNNPAMNSLPVRLLIAKLEVQAVADRI